MYPISILFAPLIVSSWLVPLPPAPRARDNYRVLTLTLAFSRYLLRILDIFAYEQYKIETLSNTFNRFVMNTATWRGSTS